MLKNEFVRFFAVGFALGALIIGSSVAQAHEHVASLIAIHATTAAR